MKFLFVILDQLLTILYLFLVSNMLQNVKHEAKNGREDAHRRPRIQSKVLWRAIRRHFGTDGKYQPELMGKDAFYSGTKLFCFTAQQLVQLWPALQPCTGEKKRSEHGQKKRKEKGVKEKRKTAKERSKVSKKETQKKGRVSLSSL